MSRSDEESVLRGGAVFIPTSSRSNGSPTRSSMPEHGHLSTDSISLYSDESNDTCSTAPCEQRVQRHAGANEVSDISEAGDEKKKLLDEQCRIDCTEANTSMAGKDGEPSSTNHDAPPRVCRICFEAEDPSEIQSNPLISPCLCAGSSRYVHRQCLQQWREANKTALNSQAYFRCEICHYKYEFIRLDRAALLSHPVVVGAGFALMLLVSCAVFGVVPIIQACLEAYEVHFNGVFHLLVHLADGLLVLGLVSVFFVACTSPQLAPIQPGRLCYNCSLIMCYCRLIGCGEVFGPVWLLFLVMMALLGLLNSIPLAFQLLYGMATSASQQTVHMVENVQTPQKNVS